MGYGPLPGSHNKKAMSHTHAYMGHSTNTETRFASQSIGPRHTLTGHVSQYVEQVGCVLAW